MREATPNFRDALILTGGGTGGHFFPAIALAEGARAKWPDRQISVVGARRGIEARELPASSWPHLLLDVEGLVGRSPLHMAKSGWKLWRAVSLLKALWRQDRPWAVIGTGGYGAAPALLAARSLGIPYFLHESNAAPGALVRQVAPQARRVWCGMEALRAQMPGADCRVVGTPVREAFLRDFRSAETLQSPFHLLVLGGSGGARAINEALLEIAPALLDQMSAWEILHQVGPAEQERLRERPRHPRHAMVPFITRMDEAMESASFVVSRAGASTCAELKATGRGAILVPLPTSAGGHQRMNALAMAAEGRATVIDQAADLALRLEAVTAAADGRPPRSTIPVQVPRAQPGRAALLGGCGGLLRLTGFGEPGHENGDEVEAQQQDAEEDGRDDYIPWREEGTEDDDDQGRVAPVLQHPPGSHQAEPRQEEEKDRQLEHDAGDDHGPDEEVEVFGGVQVGPQSRSGGFLEQDVAEEADGLEVHRRRPRR